MLTILGLLVVNYNKERILQSCSKSLGAKIRMTNFYYKLSKPNKIVFSQFQLKMAKADRFDILYSIDFQNKKQIVTVTAVSIFADLNFSSLLENDFN